MHTDSNSDILYIKKVSYRQYARLETYFNLLTHQRTECGYYTKPSKSVLIEHTENTESVKVFCSGHRFKVCTGACYLRGYIRDDESKHDYLRERKLTWEKNIETIRETIGKYLQDSYAVVAHAIQPEWIFLQHVTWDTGSAFAGVEKMIWEKIFLVFSSERKNPVTHRRISKYDYGQ